VKWEKKSWPTKRNHGYVRIIPMLRLSILGTKLIVF
jgi:hypothetical protein